MSIKNTINLILLSAIWGSSFIFMRVLSPILGPVATAGFRLFIASLFLFGYFKLIHHKIHWKRDYKVLLALGIINSAIPFYLYSFAALHIPSTLSVIINSLSPIFGALFSALFLKDQLTLKKGIGLLLGFTGVVVISIGGQMVIGTNGVLAVLACVLATICYGLSGVIIKKWAMLINPKSIAGASQFFAGIALLLFLPFNMPTHIITPTHVGLLVVFAILCSGFAYLIYYKLMIDIGPTKTLTVTFLMPVFGVFWGVVLLGEQFTLQTLFGALIILSGTYLVTHHQ